MQGILLTQNDGAILGPIAKVLGFIMNAIFNFLDLIGIPNIGLSIILRSPRWWRPPCRAAGRRLPPGRDGLR